MEVVAAAGVQTTQEVTWSLARKNKPRQVRSLVKAFNDTDG